MRDSGSGPGAVTKRSRNAVGANFICPDRYDYSSNRRYLANGLRRSTRQLCMRAVRGPRLILFMHAVK